MICGVQRSRERKHLPRRKHGRERIRGSCGTAAVFLKLFRGKKEREKRRKSLEAAAACRDAAFNFEGTTP
jgi:hypothetical protein